MGVRDKRSSNLCLRPAMTQEFDITYLPNLPSHPFVQVFGPHFPYEETGSKVNVAYPTRKGQGWNLKPYLSDPEAGKQVYCTSSFSKMHVSFAQCPD